MEITKHFSQNWQYFPVSLLTCSTDLTLCPATRLPALLDTAVTVDWNIQLFLLFIIIIIILLLYGQLVENNHRLPRD